MATTDGQPQIITPFDGIGLKATLRFRNGAPVAGRTHGTAQPLTGSDTVAKSICGRRLRPVTIYSPESWAQMVDEFTRRGGEPRLGTCSYCVQRYLQQLDPRPS